MSRTHAVEIALQKLILTSNNAMNGKAELRKKYEIHTGIDVFLVKSINSKRLSANDCPFIYLLSLLKRTEDGAADSRTSYYNKPNAKTKSTLSTSMTSITA